MQSWDANGNLSRFNGMDLSYDAMNRLVSVSGPGIEARFTYDYRNRVTSRTYNGETTFLVYDDWNLIAEYDAAGQLKARYVHGPRIDEVILTVNNHGTFFHHHDALGSVTHLTDLNGIVVESYQYDIYGNATIFDGTDAFLETSAINNRFLFTGREYLPELDLYDYRNRIYSADLGRFIQTDPIRFDAGDVNIYRYVSNNPLRWVDPMGLSREITNSNTRAGHFFEGLRQTVDLVDAFRSALSVNPNRMAGIDAAARPVTVAVANFGMGLGKMAEAVFNQHQYSTMPRSASEMWRDIDRQVIDTFNIFDERE
ncbi:MAG: RHS repeat-associated core domain-containing protein [Opitutales bacterium]|nr:RHS repeat-associated core domain-containing protein [Opitutales bacterium]